MKTAPAHTEVDVQDEVEAVLTWHNGDVRAAIATLLQDCCYLRDQLQLTESAMSAGFARGWRPSYNRD
nr:hypothetical protein [Ensifer aridi]